MNKISIIIPVFNEQITINHTIEKIYDFNDLLFEIIVVDADIAGSTINSINRKDILKIISAKGRARQMNAGAAKASGDILLFLHADTDLPPDGLKKIIELFEEKNYIGGAFNLKINAKGILFRVIEKVASFRSQITRIPYGDQGIFIEKNFFEKIGRFKEIPLMEDVDLMERIKKAKGKIHIFNDKINTSARRWEKEGILYCTIRNWIIITLYYLGIPPEKLSRYYK